MVELKTIETVDTSPFKHLIMTIGELPSSFVDSMSYYEMLAWLCNYLENTVIPAVNGNAEATQELQAAFVTLKDYVDNYFDNLDVQEEIDKKLDEMAESGVLQQLIDTYFNQVTTMVQEQNAVIDNFKTQTNTDIANFKTSVNTSINAQNTNINQLITRMDTFSSLDEGSTTGDAELADGRISFTGRTFANIGDNIRKYQGIAFTNITNAEYVTHTDDYYTTTAMQQTALENYETWAIKTIKGAMYLVDVLTSGSARQAVVLGYGVSTSTGSGSHEGPYVFIGNGGTVFVNNSKNYTSPFIGVIESALNSYDSLTNEYTDITNSLTLTPNKYMSATGELVASTPRSCYSFTPKAGHKYRVVTCFGDVVPLCYQDNGCVYPNGSGSYGSPCQGEYEIMANNSNTLYINLWGSHLAPNTFKVYESNQNFGVSNVTNQNNCAIGAFDKVVFIGDSLTNGSTYTSDSTSYLNYYNIERYLSKIWNIDDYSIIAHGGYNASEWWDRYKDDIVDENCLYIVWLGTNDGLTDTVATDCAGDDYTQFANTNTGNYGKIVGKIKSLNNTKVILLNTFRNHSSTVDTNEAISDIATKYSCPVVNTNLDIVRSSGYHTAYNGYFNAIHFNSQGHSLIANLINEQIKDYMNNNPASMEIYKVRS